MVPAAATCLSSVSRSCLMTSRFSFSFFFMGSLLFIGTGIGVETSRDATIRRFTQLNTTTKRGLHQNAAPSGTDRWPIDPAYREVSPSGVADDQAQKVGDALRALVAQAAGAFVIEATANLIERCPVKTGHARANFVPAVGEAFSGEAQDGSAQAAGLVAVAAYKLGDGPLTITNNAPYIGRLIGGSSSQAPAGWDLEAIDRAAQTIQAQYEVDIDVTQGVPGLVGPTVSIRGRAE